MRVKLHKPDNELFINIINFLEKNNQGLNKKKIGEQIGITGQRISHIKAGTSVTKKELIDLKEAYRAELMHFDASLNYSEDFTMNDLLERLKALEAGQAGKLDKSEFEEVRNLVIRMAAKVL